MRIAEIIHQTLTLNPPRETMRISVDIAMPRPKWLPMEYQKIKTKWLALRLTVEYQTFRTEAFAYAITHNRVFNEGHIAAATFLEAAQNLEEYMKPLNASPSEKDQRNGKLLLAIHDDILEEARKAKYKAGPTFNRSIPLEIKHRISEMNLKRTNCA